MTPKIIKRCGVSAGKINIPYTFKNKDKSLICYFALKLGEVNNLKIHKGLFITTHLIIM